MSSKEKMLEKYYKEDGLSALKARLKTLSDLYLKKKEEDYPFKAMMLGFPSLQIFNKVELAGRILELKDILMGMEVVYKGEEE